MQKHQKVYRSIEGRKKNEDLKKYVRRLKLTVEKKQIIKVNFRKNIYFVEFSSYGPIITEFGKFLLIITKVLNSQWGRHHFLFYPNLEKLLKQEEIQIRIDSGCFSGMVLGDITCDCQEQLKKAQKMCVSHGCGIIIEIFGQDGRGWGEDFKMVNQKIMDECNLDTVTTAELFYGSRKKIDIRNYEECFIILKALGFDKKNKFVLLTNNPLKLRAFKKYETKLLNVKSIEAENCNHIVKKHLKAKKYLLGHNLKIK